MAAILDASRLIAIITLALTFAGGVQAQDTLAPARTRLADRVTPCHVPGLDEEVLCGRFEVFENRAARGGRRISLNVVVLPARSERPAADPLTFLAGGGVLPATRYARTFARTLNLLRDTRDIVLVDQRGTGKSNPLACSAFHGRKTPVATEADAREAARACLQEVEQTGDARFYTTPIAMDDLDDVREWLGYARWNIWGASYGTKAAQAYLRQHPDRVRALVLHGPVPIFHPMWLDLASSAQKGLDDVWAACEADAECRSAFPNVRAEWSALLARLARQPAKVSWKDPETGAAMEKAVTERDVRDLVYNLLYAVPLAVQIPMVVHRAFGGDFDAFGEPPPGPGEIPRGVLLSLLCSEELARVDRARVAEATRRSFFGEWPLRQQLAWCDAWPKGEIAEPFWTPVGSDVPTLIMTGAFDSTTPPRYGEAVARTLPRATTIVLPNRAHNDLDACVTGLVQAFVARGSAEGLDTGCLAKTPPLRFPTAPAGVATARPPRCLSSAGLPPSRSFGGLAGASAEAVRPATPAAIAAPGGSVPIRLSSLCVVVLLLASNPSFAGPAQKPGQETGFRLLSDFVLVLDRAGRGGLDDSALSAAVLDLSKQLKDAREGQRVDPIFAVRYSRLLSGVRQAVLRDPDLLYWPMYRSSMIAFIEERTGRLPDWDKLRFVVNDHGGSGVGLAMLVEAVMGEVVSLHLHLETLDRRPEILRAYLERAPKSGEGPKE